MTGVTNWDPKGGDHNNGHAEKGDATKGRISGMRRIKERWTEAMVKKIPTVCSGASDLRMPDCPRKFNRRKKLGKGPQNRGGFTRKRGAI